MEYIVRPYGDHIYVARRWTAYYPTGYSAIVREGLVQADAWAEYTNETGRPYFTVADCLREKLDKVSDTRARPSSPLWSSTIVMPINMWDFAELGARALWRQADRGYGFRWVDVRSWLGLQGRGPYSDLYPNEYAGRSLFECYWLSGRPGLRRRFATGDLVRMPLEQYRSILAWELLILPYEREAD